MKAILIDREKRMNIDELNRQLKDVYKIEKEISTDFDYILIVSEYTRKDKLEQLKKISDERTNNNSV